MRLVSFRPSAGGEVRVGVLVGDEVADLSATGLPSDMAAFLAAGDEGMEAARRATAGGSPRLSLSDVVLMAPVPRPPKFLAIGLNYRAHAAETGRPLPEFQMWFNKQRTCVVGPGEPIVVPSVSDEVDYEGELAFVIGRRCRHVPASDAPSVIAGYTVVDDVSVRDWQRRTPTMTMGKSFDTHGPMGPHLVTADEVGDPHRLSLRTWVSGELRQEASTDDLVFNCWQMVEHLSTAFTLEPGDVISTGTPAGVGMAADPPRYLRPGDTVRVEIEGVGVLENPVVAETRAS
ncbi:MAG TPA: fumarylacetoacetate hydrolase family protein [Acidimicrobiales bacterium]|nr:fumarylacetoacetate hydrolase family protein [Acidimicrobiales bacterium]